ncbi:MAG: Gx transporter family protein [Sulfuriferula sp.]
MTALTIKLKASPEDHRIARMAALAIGLTLMEAALPSPLPGVKPGLANIVTLLVLKQHGMRTAAWVSALRVVAGSLLLGSFLTPGFFLSASGAIASLAVLWLAQRLPEQLFGAVSLSVLAAFAHIAGQMAIVYFWLIPTSGVLYLTPVFAAAALVFGLVNGLVAAHLLATPVPATITQETA